jgi:hypothetical protein
VRATILTLALASLLLFPLRRAAAGEVAFRRVAQTGRVSYYSQAGQPGDVDVRSSEAFLDRLVALFGAPGPAWHVEYYRHPSVEALSARLGFAAYGATDTTSLRVDSARAFHPHELVHAVTAGLGRPPALFTEGIAVALTAQGRWRGRDVHATARGFARSGHGLESPLRRFAEEDPDTDYAVSGSFAAFLLDRYGVEAFAAFLRACPSPSDYERALQAAYGRGLADLEFDWHRSLERPETPRAWYDARTWPGTLRRGGAAPGPATASAPPPSLRQRLLESAPRPAGAPRLAGSGSSLAP